ncbi:MAG: hypothetical protein RSA50_04505, partial [Mucinivorans sp.]
NIFSIFLLVALCSCTRTIYTPVHTTERIVDTLVRVEPDSSLLRALMECDSNNQVVMRSLDVVKGATAHSQATFHQGQLEVQTRWRTQYIDRVREVRDTVVVVQNRDVVRPVRHIPTLFWITFFLSISLVGFIVWKIVKS